MRRWLDGFAYRVDLDAFTFVAAVLLTWLVACGTVLAHVVRAARARPVEALRYE
jgi:putative ABC transport system permease protein